MRETQFTFRREEEEEPLFLDSQRDAGGPPGSSAGLYLDRSPARAPRRRGRRLPLILASVLTFVLAAGAAWLVLEPPPALRGTIATLLGTEDPAPPPRVSTATPKPVATVEAPPPAETGPMAEAAAAASAAAEDAALPEQAPPEAAAPPPAPKVEPKPEPKPKPAVKKKAEAPPSRKPPAKKPAAKSSLDLDALERSLE